MGDMGAGMEWDGEEEGDMPEMGEMIDDSVH